jgi:hypothetical protein
VDGSETIAGLLDMLERCGEALANFYVDHRQKCPGLADCKLCNEFIQGMQGMSTKGPLCSRDGTLIREMETKWEAVLREAALPAPASYKR